MLWLYLSGIMLLVGAEVDAAIARAAVEAPPGPVTAARDVAA